MNHLYAYKHITTRYITIYKEKPRVYIIIYRLHTSIP